MPTHLSFNLQVVDLLLHPSEVSTGRRPKPLRSLQDLRHEPCPLQTLKIVSIKYKTSRLLKSLLMHLIAASITTGRRRHLHDVDGEEEIHALGEAKAAYSGRKAPDFVIGQPSDCVTREVLFRPRNKRDDSLMNGEPMFEFWNQEQNRGFWTLTDDGGFGWIVKYFATGPEYRAIIGVESAYDPIARNLRMIRLMLEEPFENETSIRFVHTIQR
jgi:hypothetical protein